MCFCVWGAGWRMTAESRARSPWLGAAAQAAAAEGDTAPPPADEDINLHFVAFVHKDGEPRRESGVAEGGRRRPCPPPVPSAAHGLLGCCTRCWAQGNCGSWTGAGVGPCRTAPPRPTHCCPTRRQSSSSSYPPRPRSTSASWRWALRRREASGCLALLGMAGKRALAMRERELQGRRIWQVVNRSRREANRWSAVIRGSARAHQTGQRRAATRGCRRAPPSKQAKPEDEASPSPLSASHG